ncbi:hypothetical protein AB5J49_34040 [Streptomyces sp. R28]|uniref:Uncharacterized protein n=1 Tax=Streptomyces sp. R28 TaxID=3238628 RepID=A0AB39Q998_9ACTN
MGILFDDTYHVVLREEGRRIVDFNWRQMPWKGLCFEHEQRKLRVVDISVRVPTMGEQPYMVECDVVEAYRWVEDEERWDPVT